MKSNSKSRKPCFLKIVYFDEGSAMDYLEAKHGGQYDKVSSDIVQRVKKIAGEVGVEASTDPKILSFVVDSLLGIDYGKFEVDMLINLKELFQERIIGQELVLKMLLPVINVSRIRR